MTDSAESRPTTEQIAAREMAEGLMQQALAARELSRTIMAAALALEDGTLSEAEAKQLIKDQGDDSVGFSDVYPGDEYYDRADDELRLF